MIVLWNWQREWRSLGFGNNDMRKKVKRNTDGWRKAKGESGRMETINGEQ